MSQFNVLGMSCGHCVKAISNAIKALDDAAVVEVDLAQGQVRVQSSLTDEQIKAAIDDAGFELAAD